MVESPYFGRMLVLDGVVQLSERDEFFYHEMLTQVAMHAHPHPQEVLIVGGGDGGALREVLKHSSVKKVTLVEIDPEVVKVSQAFFPSLAQGFADPRTEVVFAEGSAFVKGQPLSYDIIIVDSTDPVGMARSLFTDAFFGAAQRALKGGIFVAQTESLHFHREFLRQVQRELSALFRYVGLYTQALATYPGNWWTFSIASQEYDPRGLRRAVAVPCRFYSDEVHRYCFLPEGVRGRLLSGEWSW